MNSINLSTVILGLDLVSGHYQMPMQSGFIEKNSKQTIVNQRCYYSFKLETVWLYITLSDLRRPSCELRFKMNDHR